MSPSRRGTVADWSNTKHTVIPQLEPIGEPFPVTRITSEYGEPADHRATLVNDELVVVYQSSFGRMVHPPAADLPSLREISPCFRLGLSTTRPAFAKADRCSTPPTCARTISPITLLHGHLRELRQSRRHNQKFGLWTSKRISSTRLSHEDTGSDVGVPDNIGNSLLADGDRLWMIDTGPDRSAALTVSALDPDLCPGPPVFEEPAHEQHFPVSSRLLDDFIFVGYGSRPRGGSPLPDQNPYAPYLKIFTRDLNLSRLIRKMGEAGFLAVHASVVRLGDRLLFAWGTSVNLGDRIAPQGANRRDTRSTRTKQLLEFPICR